VTTYLDFAPQQPGQRFAEALQTRLDLIQGRSYVDYAIHLIIAQLPPGWERDLAALVDAGVTSAKVYTTYRDTIFYADDWTWSRLMQRSGEAGFLVQVHAENDAIVEGMSQQLVDEGKRSLKYHALARPAVAEAEAVGRGLLFSRATGSPVYFVHLSTPLAVDLIDDARRSGVPAIAETCPHYLTFAAEEIAPGATAFKCAPPIRSAVERERLWAALEGGSIDLVATDHSPAPPAMKQIDTGDFVHAWGGIASLQVALGAVWTGAHARGIAPERLARWMSAAPAALAGLHARKGSLSAGHDADLVIWDPDATWQVDAARLYSRHRITPYAGHVLRGQVKQTLLRGEVVFDDRRGIDETARGALV